MAGFYPDVPAPRMAYDRDGTVGFKITIGTGATYQLTTTNLQTINDENTNTFQAWDEANTYFGLVFPQLRDIVGYSILAYASGGGWDSRGAVQTSTNTTNGLDGTWTTHASSWNPNGDASIPALRTSITALNVSGTKAIRFAGDADANDAGYLRCFHIYGGIATGQTPDRLRLWHPTLDEPLDDNNSTDGAWLDWGDTTRGTTADKQFRVKNNSSTLTANSIDLTINVPTDTSPTVASQHTLSNGGSFASTINIGNLAPNEISPVLTLRRSTASNATLSLWTGRININPGSWS